MKDEKLKSRIENEAQSARPIRNKDLVCKDCAYRFLDESTPSNTSKCDIFDVSKPASVLLGKECRFYVSETEGK